IYNELLGGEEDFDARLGLTYSLLQSGDIKGAKENVELVKPQYSYQERELQEFYAYMSKETRQAPDVRYYHYNDTDDNQYDRYTLGYGFRLNNWRGRIAYVYTSASDNTRDNSESSVSVNVSSKLSDRTDIKAGLGITILSNSDNNTFITGNTGISRTFGSNVTGISVARSYMTSTAELIANRIRMDIYSVNYDYTLNSRTSLNASLSYRDYSDDNTSFEILAAPRYMLYTDNPGIAIGYRLRYLGFENDSNGGYFDPDTFISNELFTTVSYEKGRFYCYLEPYAGHQYFRRSGSTESDIFGGGYSLLGYKVQKNTSIEVSAEGGNYAMSSASGFRYYMIGLRLSLLL
ncbi:MAG: hypothetical protein IT393_07680, partial [Nitrospirae bacterium]|nr:hypothetical protein [Nitrospirota bacterium]